MHTDNQHKNSYWCIIFKALAVCYTQMNSSAPPAAGSAKEINVDLLYLKIMILIFSPLLVMLTDFLL